MRTPFILLALLPLTAAAAIDQQSDEELEGIIDPAIGHERAYETIVVTADRAARAASETPASVSRIGADDIADLSAKHQDEILNRIAGVYVQHGSGQESLGAIRSPVLAGAGACGVFLVAEDSLPIRPTGFCNLNEMFEINYEQAAAVEVLRGPGSALFGASAVHGIVNVLTPGIEDIAAFSSGLEFGPNSFKRVRLALSSDMSDDIGFGLYGTATRAPGWRDASGVDEAKLNLASDVDGFAGGKLRVRAAGTVLNQETAGFIQGFNSYRDDAIARSNPNPEAFRDASSVRVSAHYGQDTCELGNTASCFELAGIYRRSRMDFLQHFLVGKPLEHNAQTSYMVSGSYALPLGEKLRARVAFDAETAQSELTEFQPGPATDGAPAANAIRPTGFHYNYTVDSSTLGASVGLEYHLLENLSIAAALRLDRTNYDYDNRMIDGNTRDDGTPCAAAGCLYARPADSSDDFDNLAPRVTLSWAPAPAHLLYVSASSGFRPPEMTEVYRLQRQQTVADLDSEQLEAAEIGWKFGSSDLALTAALYDMKKKHVILRDSNGFNVSDGSTSHRGFEYEAHWRASAWLQLYAAGTYARHEYTFSRSIEGGETIVSGNDVDTAPRHMHNAGVEARLGQQWHVALDGSYVGGYFLDAANTATYPGHKVANARAGWTARLGRYQDLRVVLRIDNLFDKAYADRADFAFGNYRYFPAQGRAVFLSVDFVSR
jgi:outer membrane receptor protein involved in Fe transport